MKPLRLIGWPMVGRAAVALVALFLACPGCGDMTPPEKAQAVVSSGAEVVAAFDVEAAERYTEAAERFLVEVDFDAWREAMRPWDRLEEALRGAKATLLAAQAAVNVWQATGDGSGFIHVAACLFAEIDLLMRAAATVGLEDELDKLRPVLTLGAAYAAGVCARGGDQ